MTDATFDALCELYEVDLRILDNPACMACDATVREPLMMWHVGSEYWTSPVRLLFVGKPHRGIVGDPRPSGLRDPRQRAAELRRESWAYWRYTAEVARRIHADADDAWSRVALTNLVKCTNVEHKSSKSTDKTTRCMVEQCAVKLGVITSEIRFLRPTHVIFYTAQLHGGLFEQINLCTTTEWETVKREGIACGKKHISWWEWHAEAEWGERLQVLHTAHPERKKKQEYVDLLVDWVRRTS